MKKENGKYKSYNVPVTGWEAFKGKTVVAYEINAQTDVMRFTLSDGGILYASAVGGCCSRSWFEHVEGVEALLGSEVFAIEERPMPEGEEDANGELTQFYGWTLSTTRGRFDVELRNESNGYYGGSVIVSDVVTDQYHCEVEEGFVPFLRVAISKSPAGETISVSEIAGGGGK